MALPGSRYRSKEENCKMSQVTWVARGCARFAALIMAVIFNSSCEANMFAKEDVVLFSRVQGKIMYQGVPVANAKVIRRYKYDTPQSMEDSCMTDAEGIFELPTILLKNANVTPLVQFVVHQQLFVERNGEQQQIWSHGKMEKSESSEYGGEFKKISCDLAVEPKRRELGLLNVVYTNCEW